MPFVIKLVLKWNFVIVKWYLIDLKWSLKDKKIFAEKALC